MAKMLIVIICLFLMLLSSSVAGGLYYRSTGTAPAAAVAGTTVALPVDPAGTTAPATTVLPTAVLPTAVVAATMAPSTAPSAPVLLAQPLKWSNQSSNYTRYLDCDGGACSATSNKTQIWQGSGAAGQSWTYDGSTGGGVTSGGHCLATVNNGVTSGTPVVAYGSCDNGGKGGTGGQQWVWQQAGDFATTGGWQLKNPMSGLCLDIAGGVDANGSLTQLWDCAGSWSRWLPVAWGQ